MNRLFYHSANAAVIVAGLIAVSFLAGCGGGGRDNYYYNRQCGYGMDQLGLCDGNRF